MKLVRRESLSVMSFLILLGTTPLTYAEKVFDDPELKQKVEQCPSFEGNKIDEYYQPGRVWLSDPRCYTDPSLINIKLRVKRYAESIGQRVATNLFWDDPLGGRLSSRCLQRSAAFFYRKYYYPGEGRYYQYSVFLMNEHDISYLLDDHQEPLPSDNSCVFGESDGKLIGFSDDVDCSEEQKNGILISDVLQSCGLAEGNPEPSRAKGKPEQCRYDDSAGNPISISTGNKYQEEVLLSSALPLIISYNSLDQQWRHNYLQAIYTDADKLSLIRADGKGFSFTQSSGVWTADDGDIFYRVEAFDDGQGSAWRVTTPSGDIERYNAQGQILSSTSLQGQTLSFTYANTVTTVADEFGNQLELTHEASGHLVQASYNGQLQANLSYVDNRLVTRTDAANQTIEYHYEDTNFPNHLTGITGADGQRFATWAYDSEGRGILSEHAAQERVTLAFNNDGSTTVTNPLGKQTTYHYEEIEGVKRPVQIEGHASDNCVAANKAYTYYPNGLLETQTDWSGHVTRFEYNDRGLIIRVIEAQGTIHERSTDQIWHDERPLLLERRKQGVTERYHYDASYRLLRRDLSN